MEQICLINEMIEIQVNSHGAELRSLKNIHNNKQYLWNADPAFWNRSSPVLFPFVGGVKDKVYRHNGAEYPMNQHGFARDMEFTLLHKTEDEVWFALDSTEETYQVYPFHFHLEIGYRLEENTVAVMWKVKNTGDEVMYFAIGAHPAFYCPFHKDEKQSDCFLRFVKKNGEISEKIVTTVFGQGGCVTTKKAVYELEQGVLPIAADLFDGDALVIEEEQVHQISLLDKEKREYLRVDFDSPLVGVWSPPKKQAPFVCIEPWYGRCDSEIFTGQLKERDWENALDPDSEFYAEYKMSVY